MANVTNNSNEIDQRAAYKLAEIARTLPDPEETRYPYELVIVTGKTAYVAGQISKQGGELSHIGKVGRDISVKEATASARICAQQALSWLNHSAGGIDNLDQILRVTCYVAHDDSFEDISAVADGASNYFNETLGDQGRHVRAVVGVKSLPRNAPVLIEITASLVAEI